MIFGSAVKQALREIAGVTVRPGSWMLGVLLVAPSLSVAQEIPPYFEVGSVTWNQADGRDAQLETPLGCVEQFVVSARAGEWYSASAALDFRLLGEVDRSRAEQLARRFFYVLNQELWIDWDRLPDRPDAVFEPSGFEMADPMTGRIRRSLKLGSISIGERSAPIRIHRVKAPGEDPVWLFSAHTVESIDRLWQHHGPSRLAQQLPEWSRDRGLWRIPIWQWIILSAVLMLAPLFSIWVAGRLCRSLSQALPPRGGELCKRLRIPLTGFLISLLIWLSLEWLLAMPSEVATFLESAFLIATVAMAVWMAGRAITFSIDTVVRGAIREIQDEHSVRRRRLLTKVTVARHVLLLIVVLVGVAVVLTHFNSLRALGVTMLTSAGAMAVIFGLAGRAVLGNLIAGLQIAFNQPFRIGDTVLIEGNWGQIEDITYVDVIVRTWDHRRLVMPIGYFVSNWFENWSKTDPFLTKAIYLEVDYQADVEAIRKKFIEVVKEDPDWDSDRDEPQTLVTDSGDETMTLRLTCGGSDPSRAWSLICRVREKMLAWLREVEGGDYLPRRRLVMLDAPGPSPEAPTEQRGQNDSRAGEGGDAAEEGEASA